MGIIKTNKTETKEIKHPRPYGRRIKFTIIKLF